MRRCGFGVGFTQIESQSHFSNLLIVTMESEKAVRETKEPVVSIPSQGQSDSDEDAGKRPPPLWAKLFAVLLISCISFGSRWSSGVTGAMKSTIKKVCASALRFI